MPYKFLFFLLVIALPCLALKKGHEVTHRHHRDSPNNVYYIRGNRVIPASSKRIGAKGVPFFSALNPDPYEDLKTSKRKLRVYKGFPLSKPEKREGRNTNRQMEKRQ